MATPNELALSNAKRFLCRNPEYRVRTGFRVKVPRSAKKVYIPRKNHYARKVYTEDENIDKLEAFYDDLQPCVVTKGLFGWQPHQCPYHSLVIIEEQ